MINQIRGQKHFKEKINLISTVPHKKWIDSIQILRKEQCALINKGLGKKFAE